MFSTVCRTVSARQTKGAWRRFCFMLGMLAALGLPLSPESALAQQPNFGNALGGLIGDLARASAKANAQKAWGALSPVMQSCMDRSLSIHRSSTSSLISQGISPSDSRLTQYVDQCQSLTSRELQSDMPCTIVELGVSISTKCNEAYAENTGSMVRYINRDQYILDGLRGQNVTIAQVEASEAMHSRVEQAAQQKAAADAQQQQQQAAAAAQQQKEQAAAAAQQQKQAEAARQKQAAADLAIHQALAKRDQEVTAGRKSCVAKSAGAFSQVFSNNSDHKVLASLLDTNVPPVEAYQGTIAWLPSTTERSAILNALHDRIDYDAKRYGVTIARSGGGDYSWDNLKVALQVIGSSCLWDQYDQLGIGAALAISPQSVAAATGQAQATTDAAKVAVVILSKIPSSKYFH